MDVKKSHAEHFSLLDGGKHFFSLHLYYLVALCFKILYNFTRQDILKQKDVFVSKKPPIRLGKVTLLNITKTTCLNFTFVIFFIFVNKICTPFNFLVHSSSILRSLRIKKFKVIDFRKMIHF